MESPFVVRLCQPYRQRDSLPEITLLLSTSHDENLFQALQAWQQISGRRGMWFEVEGIKEDKKTSTLFFANDYQIIIKPGPKRKGVLVINDKPIPISPIQSDLCVIMARQLIDDWKYIGERDYFEVGWVSYNDFRNLVPEWISLENEGGAVSNRSIIRPISDLNKKIKKFLNFTEDQFNLIENGAKHGRAKNYRFRVYPKLISIE